MTVREYASGLSRLAVTQSSSDFGGSNPSLPDHVPVGLKGKGYETFNLRARVRLPPGTPSLEVDYENAQV